MAGYIGGKVAVSAPQQIETKHTITATASQTSIPNVGYTVGAVHVYQNGIRLVDGTDYTATNGSTVTLETGATEGDQIVIVSHGSFETGDVVSAASGGTFSGNVTVSGSVTANSLVVPDGSIPLVDLDIDGGTDIGAALVDADLMVVDDGAGGTNRKATMSRLATYMGTKIGGGLEFISSTDVSATTNIAFTGFDSSKYDSYLFTFAHITPDTDNVGIYLRTSTDGGSSYDSTSGDYLYFTGRGFETSNAYSRTDDSDGNTTYAPVSPPLIGIASSPEALVAFSGTLEILHPHLAEYTAGFTKGFYLDNAGRSSYSSGGFVRAAQSDVDAIQFGMTSGDFAAGGTITMYGMVNS